MLDGPDSTTRLTAFLFDILDIGRSVLCAGARTTLSSVGDILHFSAAWGEGN